MPRTRLGTVHSFMPTVCVAVVPRSRHANASTTCGCLPCCRVGCLRCFRHVTTTPHRGTPYDTTNRLSCSCSEIRWLLVGVGTGTRPLALSACCVLCQRRTTRVMSRWLIFEVKLSGLVCVCAHWCCALVDPLVQHAWVRRGLTCQVRRLVG